jgi:hypothetical protein
MGGKRHDKAAAARADGQPASQPARQTDRQTASQTANQAVHHELLRTCQEEELCIHDHRWVVHLCSSATCGAQHHPNILGAAGGGVPVHHCGQGRAEQSRAGQQQVVVGERTGKGQQRWTAACDIACRHEAGAPAQRSADLKLSEQHSNATRSILHNKQSHIPTPSKGTWSARALRWRLGWSGMSPPAAAGR